MTQPIIEVEHLTKEFRLGSFASFGQTLSDTLAKLRGKPSGRAPFKALDDVSFSVAPGEVLGIIGHNGAGKSTLLKILAGISRPTRGRVAVNGRVAPLIEVGAGLVPDMTGRENIFLNASILGMSRVETRRRFDEIVDFAELAEFIDTPIKRFSSGMQVRLGFAIATSIESEILIVDEVLAVGDLAFQRKCFDRMEQLIRRLGRTVLLVSHNLRQVEHLCSRVFMLERGKVVADGDPQEVCDLFYGKADERIRQMVEAAHSERKPGGEGSDDAEFISLSFVDAAGQETKELAYHEDALLRLRVRINRAVRKPVFGIGVQTTDFFRLVNFESETHLRLDVLDVGTHDLYCRISRFPLLPGAYSLLTGLVESGSTRVLYYEENVLAFQVTSGRRKIPFGVRHGFFEMDVAWSCAADEQQAQAPCEDHAAPPGRNSVTASQASAPTVVTSRSE